MYSGTVNSRLGVLGLTLAALVGATFLLQPLENRARVLAAPGELRMEQLTVAAGHGGTLGLLGGMRAIVASGCWLRANLAWEKRDAPATTALIELTVAADERPVYFWLNGARMMACDMPEWGLDGLAPAALRERINEAQAQSALHFLEKGLRWHGPDPALYIEMANIHLRRRGDAGSAARCYRQAAEQPGAPYYAARIHAELLCEMNRPQEALAWLRQILPALPGDDPLARREVVIGRIKALEQELAVRRDG